MRIARVLTRLNLGGPARQALASDCVLAARGHEVRILAGTPEPGEGDLFDTFVARGLSVERVPGLRRGVAPARDLVARRRIRQELSRFAPDVLHTHASKAGTLGRQALDKLPALAGTARVHTFHGHVFEGYFPDVVSRRLIAHEQRLAARTDRIVAVSHATADDLVRLEVTDEEHLVVVPPGIELEPLLDIPRSLDQSWRRSLGPTRRRIGATEEAVLVGVVGRLAEVKRVGWAVDVFQLLAERFPAFHLVFVGDGRERGGLERRIQALDERGRARVHMLGAVAEMPRVLAELDVVLLTSRSEGLPVALIEAAAAGLPAVATDVGGVSEVVAHERTGYVGSSVEELAFGLAQLLSDPTERVAMGERARLRVRRRHGAEELATRLEAVYEAALSERRERRRAGERAR